MDCIQNKSSGFKTLLLVANSVSIHRRDLKLRITEVYKTVEHVKLSSEVYLQKRRNPESFLLQYKKQQDQDSLRGMLVNKITTSKETINLLEISTVLSSWTKEKVSEIEYVLGRSG